MSSIIPWHGPKRNFICLELGKLNAVAIFTPTAMPVMMKCACMFLPCSKVHWECSKWNSLCNFYLYFTQRFDALQAYGDVSKTEGVTGPPLCNLVSLHPFNSSASSSFSFSPWSIFCNKCDMIKHLALEHTAARQMLKQDLCEHIDVTWLGYRRTFCPVGVVGSLAFIAWAMLWHQQMLECNCMCVGMMWLPLYSTAATRNSSKW